MRIISLKKMSLPKIAVLATGMAAAVLVATINPAPVAQATPSKGEVCMECHAAGGSVTATPSSATPAPGAAYTVAIAITTTTTGNSGYSITGPDGAIVLGNPVAGTTHSAAMTAPAAAGTYTYAVNADQGGTGSGMASATTYSITVGAVVTTPPTVDPTVPPTVDPTVPPTVDPTIPVESGASISSLSPTHGAVGSTVTIDGSGFGTNSTVDFGAAGATELAGTTSTDGKIVVKVPETMTGDFSPMKGVVTQNVWNRHARTVQVTVTPEGGVASIGVTFTLDSSRGDHEGDDEGDDEGDHKGDHRGEHKGDHKGDHKGEHKARR